jgi:hypothetical protein
MLLLLQVKDSPPDRPQRVGQPSETATGPATAALQEAAAVAVDQIGGKGALALITEALDLSSCSIKHDENGGGGSGGCSSMEDMDDDVWPSPSTTDTQE